jgi:hypothetical protein
MKTQRYDRPSLLMFIGLVFPRSCGPCAPAVGRNNYRWRQDVSDVSCVSQSNAAAINGDCSQDVSETIIPPEICRITDVKANGERVIYARLAAVAL